MNSQKTLQIPLWYLVKNHKFGFSDFLCRSLNAFSSQYREEERTILYFLICFYKHDKYVDGTHIVQHLLSSRFNKTHQLSFIFCIYFYLIFYGEYENDVAFTSTGEKLLRHNIFVQDYFDVPLFLQWMNIILSFLFNVGPVSYKSVTNHNSNEDTDKAMNYLNYLTHNCIIIKYKTVHKLYNLEQCHTMILQLLDFFNGKSFPPYLNIYKHNPHFFKSLVYNFWPQLLVTYNDLNAEEMDTIRRAHDELHKHGDTDFFFDYISEFVKLFGRDHVLSQELQAYLISSKENDVHMIDSFMKKCTPEKRKRYFFQALPVSDTSLKSFLTQIQEKGFEEFITKCMNQYISRLKASFVEQNYSLVNEDFFSNAVSIFHYDYDQCVYHFVQSCVFVFLPEELHELRKTRTNPYTKEILPDSLFEKAENMIYPTVSIIKDWENILRRALFS